MTDLHVSEFILPFTNKPVLLRPYRVKEEKILLAAAQDEATEMSLVRSLSQVMQCCLVGGDIDVSKLPVFEYEYLFTKLRSISDSDVLKLTSASEAYCKSTAEKPPCEGFVRFNIGLNPVIEEDPDAPVKMADAIDCQFKLDLGTKTVLVRYPTYEEVISHNINSDTYAFLEKVVVAMFEGDSVFNGNVSEFIDSLTMKEVEPLREFIRTVPKVKIEDKMRCRFCAVEKPIVFYGLDNFFV